MHHIAEGNACAHPLPDVLIHPANAERDIPRTNQALQYYVMHGSKTQLPRRTTKKNDRATHTAQSEGLLRM